MLRRLSLLALGAIALTGAVLLIQGARGARPPRHPDVVMIAVDTLRGDHLHCLGNDWISTPNLDALAADGALFSRCYATAPWTLPSFASIFTGLTPSHHGTVGGNHEVLDGGFTTLAEHLCGAGYRTYGFSTVKWLTRDFGMAQGFGSDLPVRMPRGLGGAALVTHLALESFRLPRDKPLFTFVHYFDVHAPYAPPQPFARMYYRGDERAAGAPVLDFLLSGANAAPNKASGMYDWLDGVTDLEYPRREYAAAVSYADDSVGRVVAGLKRSGRYDDALIVVVSDHGEHLGEHDLWFTHTLPYQETLHVPLIVKLPRGRAAGRVIDEPVSTLDILPSLLDWLGLPAAAPADGRSLKELVAGRDEGGRSLLVAEQGSVPRALCKSVIEWPLKLMLFRNDDGDGYALFDLEADPGETTDLGLGRPDSAARLRSRLWDVFDPRQPLGETTLARPARIDADSRDVLRSLGYVAGSDRVEADGPAVPAGAMPAAGRAAP